MGEAVGIPGLAPAEGALQQVLAGIRGGAGTREFHAGIEAGQRVLGNRAFMHWVGAQQSGGRAAVAGSLPPCLQPQGAPLQMMPKKKKQQGHAVAGKEEGEGAVPEGEEKPEAGVKLPQSGAGGTGSSCETQGPAGAGMTVDGVAVPVERKKKKSRVQVALNTLRGEGVAAFGDYIEAEIGEAALLRTLVERITRAEDLKSIRAAALAVVEARLRLPDSDESAGEQVLRKSLPLREQGQGAGIRQAPELAVTAPVKAALNLRETELFEACYKGDTGRFRRYLSHWKSGHGNVDVNVSDRLGTLLCHAAFWGYENIVRELLSLPGIDVNLAGELGCTPVYLAARNGHVKLVELLLDQRGINVNLATSVGTTPLYVAAEEGHVEVVKLLLAAPGINVNMQRSDGVAPLNVAADKGDVEVVKLLLAAPGIQVNLGVDGRYIPLGMAVQHGHKDIVRLLLRNGADPNITSGEGLTPLHVASFKGYTAIVEMLLHFGADPDAELTDLVGEAQTPGNLAVLGGHREVMSVLEAYRRRREAARRLEQLSLTEAPAEAGGSGRAGV